MDQNSKPRSIIRSNSHYGTQQMPIRNRSADFPVDFPVCRIAGFRTCLIWNSRGACEFGRGLPTGKSAIRQTGKSNAARISHILKISFCVLRRENLRVWEGLLRSALSHEARRGGAYAAWGVGL